MATKKRNYSRFYAIARDKGIQLEQFKGDIISQFTGGRSESLREMTDAEYERMCNALQYGQEHLSEEEYRESLRKARSAALTRIQKLGVDTTDFDRVNAFCQDRRIAGKPFGMLTINELKELVPKLESMLRKPARPAQVIIVPPVMTSIRS